MNTQEQKKSPRACASAANSRAQKSIYVVGTGETDADASGALSEEGEIIAIAGDHKITAETPVSSRAFASAAKSQAKKQITVVAPRDGGATAEGARSLEGGIDVIVGDQKAASDLIARFSRLKW